MESLDNFVASNPPYQDLLLAHLNRYLSQTRLSMSQVASKLSISKSYLSEIKNGKKTPQLDLGLKILKLCGTNGEQKKEWLESYTRSVSEEYWDYCDSIEDVERRKKLAEEVGSRLIYDGTLFSVFMDLYTIGNRGISQQSIIQQYGHEMIKKLDDLVRINILELKGGMYFSVNEGAFLSLNNSFELVKKVLDYHRQRLNREAPNKENPQLNMRFWLHDLSDEGYQKMNDLVDNFMIQARQIFSEHKQHRQDGGHRSMFQVMLAKLKF